MKRIIICCDGTWNKPDKKNPTNVIKLARAVLPTAPDGTSQIVFYDEGVGTGPGLDHLLGGMFGSGLEKNIGDAYRFLIHNYEDGDQIWLFGFSRGAFTARSTAGLLRNSGLLQKIHADKFKCAFKLYRRRDVKPKSETAVKFRQEFARDVDIHFLGVWDTVGARGIPGALLGKVRSARYQFHDVSLSKYVKNGYHAMAIDERRRPFMPSPWKRPAKPGQHIEQVWFAGAHSDVGGGYPDSSLSALSFQWMREKAGDCGLVFDDAYLKGLPVPDGKGKLHDSMKLYFRLLVPFKRKISTEQAEYQSVHPDVVSRYNDDALSYRPDNLITYLSDPKHKVAKVKKSEK